MEALLRYPKHERRAVAQEWARRSNAVQSAARMAREPDFDTLRWRALDDARGLILREGTTYRCGQETNWQLRRSLHGHSNQVDLLVNGLLFRTGSLRSALSAIRWQKWPNYRQYLGKAA
jgi:hypothetical protein